MREFECNRALLTMALISGIDVSMPALKLQEDSYNIHHDINQQNINNCNKLSENLLLNETFVSDCRQFPEIYISQGSVSTRFRHNGILNDQFITHITAESEVKKF